MQTLVPAIVYSGPLAPHQLSFKSSVSTATLNLINAEQNFMIRYVSYWAVSSWYISLTTSHSTELLKDIIILTVKDSVDRFLFLLGLQTAWTHIRADKRRGTQPRSPSKLIGCSLIIFLLLPSKRGRHSLFRPGWKLTVAEPKESIQTCKQDTATVQSAIKQTGHSVCQPHRPSYINKEE